MPFEADCAVGPASSARPRLHRVRSPLIVGRPWPFLPLPSPLALRSSTVAFSRGLRPMTFTMPLASNPLRLPGEPRRPISSAAKTSRAWSLHHPPAEIFISRFVWVIGDASLGDPSVMATAPLLGGRAYLLERDPPSAPSRDDLVPLHRRVADRAPHLFPVSRRLDDAEMSVDDILIPLTGQMCASSTLRWSRARSSGPSEAAGVSTLEQVCASARGAFAHDGGHGERHHHPSDLPACSTVGEADQLARSFAA